RGRQNPERRPTSRVSKPQPGKPATGRMNVQAGGTSQSESQPPAQESSKSTLYMGIGGGALVFVLILAFMLGGNDSEHKSAASADTIVNRAISKAQEAYQRGEYRIGLDLCEETMKDPRTHRSSRFTALQTTATMCRSAVDLDRNAQVKVAEFRKKIDAAKADQT